MGAFYSRNGELVDHHDQTHLYLSVLKITACFQSSDAALGTETIKVDMDF